MFRAFGNNEKINPVIREDWLRDFLRKKMISHRVFNILQCNAMVTRKNKSSYKNQR